MDILTTQLTTAGILHLTLNRPEKLNALSDDLLDALQNIFKSAQQDAQVKSLLITGTGKAFCAGADINRLKDLNAQTGYEFARQGQNVFRCLETLTKPSIAAINGYAFGGGCELAMAATLRIAAQQALFSQPEIKLGVIPGYGGTQRLARLVGKAHALELCLLGRRLTATEALHWGLVNEVTEAGNLIERSEAILKEITSLAPLAIASILKSMHGGYDLTLEAALELEATHFGLCCASEDKQEGIAAFIEKRSPHFKGQ